MPSAFNTGDTAWVLASSAMVLLMTPGLAFFYGGMVRAKSVLNMLMMNFIAIAVVTVAWVLYGWSVAFGNVGAGDGSGNGFWGGLHQWALHGIGLGFGSGASGGSLFGTTGVPTIAVVCFQLMFAIITPALISGAIADRTKFVGWTVYVAAWVDARLLPGRALGVLPQRLHHRSCTSWTSPAAPRWRSTPAPRAWPGPGPRQADRLPAGPDAPAQRAAGDARRRAAVVRLVRVQRRLGAGRQRPGLDGVREHPDRRLHRDVRLADRREDPARHVHLARRRLRRGRRPGRHHPGLRLGLAAGRDRSSA